MNQKNIKQQIINIKKEKTKLLVILFSAVLISIVISVFSYLKTSVETYTLVIMLVLVGLLVVIFLIKPKLMFVSLRHKYMLLLSFAEKPYKINETFNTKWIENVLKMGFQYSTRTEDFDVLFRISKPVEKKIFDFSNMLEIITIFKNNNHDFYSDNLHNAYKTLWVNHNNKKHINKQVIIQIKNYDKISSEIIEKLNEVTLFSEGKNHLITINIGYFRSSQTVYYLHSDKYYPNVYYKYGINQIKDLIK